MNKEIISDFAEISFDYSLLPNDALIAATCKYHGIRKSITFDSDFESLEFIEIID
ncbi:tRNA(fMet)-specific endonuclease VapC [ANME-1 cluster archaeon GoMg3.2]|nr:tRNA(fMet)-specific endonuclease VapC [ANME-1 cluster archaeon GoMg3.2]